MTLTQSHITPVDDGHQLFEILSRKNITMKNYVPVMNSEYILCMHQAKDFHLGDVTWFKIMRQIAHG